MRVTMIATVLTACGPAPSTQVQPVPAPQPQPPRMGPAVSYEVSMPWCFDHKDAFDDGGCFEDFDDCKAYRTEAVKFTMGRLVSGTKPEDIPARMDAALAAARETWTACGRADAAVCFVGHEVVKGYDLRICWPRMAACERKIRAMTSADFAPRTGCYIIRAKTP